MESKDLFYKQQNIFETISEDEKKASDAYCEDYKAYLQVSKTEREAVREAIKLAEKEGFVEFKKGMSLKAGDKVYKNVYGKALYLAVIGKQPLVSGMNIAGAHVDSPRLDLKQLPVYEDSELALLKTHYYGGIRKYQWVATPLALHGTAVLADGSVIDVAIGENDNEPKFVITDLLPHLARNQRKKSLDEAFTGEDLNVLIGSEFDNDAEKGEKVKTRILKILFEKYGIIEEDFLSAEFEIVPAAKVTDIGFDRSLIGGYGHDDRVCAFAELKAILEETAPEKTAFCILVDKEEVGSEGVSGMKSMAFEYFVSNLFEACGETKDLEECFANSFCISADVTAAYDPNFPDVFEKRNAAKANYGVGIAKFTGSGGKSGSNDASAEVVGKIRRMFRDYGVVWQMAELGKVDQGGGGTIAKIMANRNIPTIDAGVPVLSMHAPFEVVSKLDCYMTYKAMKALYAEK